MPPNAAMRSCFVICPIGAPDSDIRQRSDDIFYGLIKPVCAEEGYKASRAIDDARPGEITAQIVADVHDSDLVIADLTGHNPNVFYELALRHALGRPFIHLIDPLGTIPFDIINLNVIRIAAAGYVGVADAREALRKQIQACQEGTSFKNPVSDYHERKAAKASGNPLAVQFQELQDKVDMLLRERLSSVRRADPQVRFGFVTPATPIQTALSVDAGQFLSMLDSWSRKAATSTLLRLIRDGSMGNSLEWVAPTGSGTLTIIDAVSGISANGYRVHAFGNSAGRDFDLEFFADAASATAE